MKKQIIQYTFLLTLFLNIPHLIYSQKIDSTIYSDFIRNQTGQIFNHLLEIRRDFHKHPELSGKEERTQKKLIKYLSDLGLEVVTEPEGYGVIGILKGDKEGKKIAWRADMDALPDSSPDNFEFRSINEGVKHACGHDIHMTVALGIAEILTKYKESLHGSVYFIFQPEEETFEGAKKMVENNFISQFDIDEIYGLHITPLQSGYIMVKPNEIYAYQKKIKIEFTNILSDDDIHILQTELRKDLSRTFEEDDPSKIMSLLVDPNIGLTSPRSIFKDYSIVDQHPYIYHTDNKSYIEMQVYETDSTKLKNIIPTIEQVIKNLNYSSQLLSVSVVREPPIVINDQPLTNNAIQILNETLGADTLLNSYGQVPYSNDDFAYFQQKIPGVYFFLGGSNFEKGIIAMIHSPYFQVDEECIKVGVNAFTSLLLLRSEQ